MKQTFFIYFLLFYTMYLHFQSIRKNIKHEQEIKQASQNSEKNSEILNPRFSFEIFEMTFPLKSMVLKTMLLFM